jgi:voltage-gated potassium channel Kch
LKAARLNSARAVIIAINDRLSQEAITSIALSQNPHIIIISRSHFDEDRERLLASGVNFVIQPEFEAGIAIISLLLSLYKKSTHETNSLLNQIRRERNL